MKSPTINIKIHVNSELPSGKCLEDTFTVSKNSTVSFRKCTLLDKGNCVTF